MTTVGARRLREATRPRDLARTRRESGQLAVRMFGPIEVDGRDSRLGPRDFGGVKPKQVLEILLAARGRPVPKDRIADYLWGDGLPQNVSATLETYVSVLRGRISPDRALSRRLIVTQPEAYRFATEEAWVDLDEFDRITHRTNKDASITRRDLERALTLARGDLFEDEPYAEWTFELREHYRERVLQTLLAAARAALAERDLHAALNHAEAALGLDQFWEPAWQLAMLASYALGQRDDALRLAARCRRLFADELGTNLGAELQEIERSILADVDPVSLLPLPASPVAELRLEPTQELPFLGRSSELAQMEKVIERALDGGFELVVVRGEAGMGKTRLLDEFASRQHSLQIGRGICSGLSRRYPFVPLAMALRNAMQDSGIDAMAFPGLAGVLPELGLSDRVQEVETQTLESIVALVRQLAPLVLILDDLHLADEHTIAALDYLADRCAAEPVVIIVSLRPEDASPQSLVRLLPKTLTVDLDSLTPDDLADAGLGQLFEPTSGHPYYLSCVDRIVRPEPPAAVRDFVLARFGTVGEHAFGLLVAASVLAEPFKLEQIAELADLSTSQALDAVDILFQRRILRVEGTRLAFQQRLEQEVLYTNMSAPRRLFLSERAATIGAELYREPAANESDVA